MAVSSVLPNQGQRRSPGQHGVDPVEGQMAHGLAGFDGGAAEMRQQHRIFEAHIAGIQRWLAVEQPLVQALT